MTDVIRIYQEEGVETIALRGIDLSIEPGEFVAVMGRSGSGKSTLLNLLAAADRPTAGKVWFGGLDLARADEVQRSALRGGTIGFVFQSQNLMPMLSLEENVRLAMALAGRQGPDGAAGELARLGLADRGHHRPEALSGGEQQRGALACVLAAQPSVILGDELTGELDSASADALLGVLNDVHVAFGTTIVVATHDPAVAARAERVVELRDGRIVDDRQNS